MSTDLPVEGLEPVAVAGPATAADDLGFVSEDADSKAIIDGVWICSGAGFVETVVCGDPEEAAQMLRKLHRLEGSVVVTVNPATVPPKPGDEVVGKILVRTSFGALAG